MIEIPTEIHIKYFFLTQYSQDEKIMMSSDNSYRWTSKIGERIFKSCEFQLGDSIIDYRGECICKCGCKNWVRNIETWTKEVPRDVKICPICHINCLKN